MCLGPGTEIQVTGNLFWRKIGPPICSADLLGFLCRFGGWLEKGGFGAMLRKVGGGGATVLQVVDVGHKVESAGHTAQQQTPFHQKLMKKVAELA